MRTSNQNMTNARGSQMSTSCCHGWTGLALTGLAANTGLSSSNLTIGRSPTKSPHSKMRRASTRSHHNGAISKTTAGLTRWSSWEPSKHLRKKFETRPGRTAATEKNTTPSQTIVKTGQENCWLQWTRSCWQHWTRKTSNQLNKDLPKKLVLHFLLKSTQELSL